MYRRWVQDFSKPARASPNGTAVNLITYKRHHLTLSTTTEAENDIIHSTPTTWRDTVPSSARGKKTGPRTALSAKLPPKRATWH